MKRSAFLLVGVTFALFVSDLSAAVTAVFTNAGAIYDGQNMVTVGLTDLDSGVSFDMFVSSIGGNLNSNSTGLGIGDAKLNAGEVLTISFSVDVSLEQIDFGEVGSTVADGVTVTIGAQPSFDLYTGQPHFSGVSDLWTPTTPVELLAGQTIQMTASSGTAIVDADGLRVSAVPEPSSVVLFGAGSLALLLRRKRV